MNIGLIGSGGREHALCKKISESKLVNKIVCFPGNAGTSHIATNVNIDILDFKGKVINEGLMLPHPRMHCRKFVLNPMKKIAPN